MKISTKSWLNYINKMSKISNTAADLMQKWIQKNGFANDKALLDYAYALSAHYGEAIAELSCQMYEATASAQKASIPSAEPAEVPEYGEVAKAVHGTMKQHQSLVPSTIGRLVKQVGADTTLKNAIRDGAEFAWVPHGDTCAFCITLASRGWQKVSKNTLRKGHAEHIHANCDCQYAVRFDGSSTVEGYDPDKYLKMYESAEGSTPQEKINSLRRSMRAQKQVLNPSITNMLDEYVLKSVGAKSRNYDIMDLQTGEMYHLAEGTKLQNKEVFAGKGSKTEYRNAYKFAEKYGGNADDWQHVKANAELKTGDGIFPAEVHWSQCEGIGKVEFFVKKWLDDES